MLFDQRTAEILVKADATGLLQRHHVLSSVAVDVIHIFEASEGLRLSVLADDATAKLIVVCVFVGLQHSLTVDLGKLKLLAVQT